jgi:hypothetical protein
MSSPWALGVHQVGGGLALVPKMMLIPLWSVAFTGRSSWS